MIKIESDTLLKIIEYLKKRVVFTNLHGEYFLDLINSIPKKSLMVIEKEGTNFIGFYSGDKFLVHGLTGDESQAYTDTNEIRNLLTSSRISCYEMMIDVFQMMNDDALVSKEVVAETISFSLAMEIINGSLDKGRIFYLVDQGGRYKFLIWGARDDKKTILWNDLVIIGEEANEYLERELKDKYAMFYEIYPDELEPTIERQSAEVDLISYGIKDKFPEETTNIIISEIKEFNYLHKYHHTFEFNSQKILDHMSILTDISESILIDYPKNIDNRLLLAALYRTQENYEDEIQILEETTKIAPDDLDILLATSGAFLRTDQVNKSIKLLEGALEEERFDELPLLIKLSSTFKRIQRHGDQLDVLNRLIPIAEDRNDTYTLYLSYYHKALALSSLGRDSDAIEWFEKAISLKSNELGPYQNLAIIIERLKGVKEAAEILKQSLIPSDDAQKIKVYNSLASLYMRHQMYDAAIKPNEMIIELMPGDTSAFLQLGIIYRLLNDSENAKRYFEKALEIDPSHPTAINNLKVLYRDHEDKKERVGLKNYEFGMSLRRTVTIDEIIRYMPDEFKGLIIDEEKIEEKHFKREEFESIYFSAFKRWQDADWRAEQFLKAAQYALNTNNSTAFYASIVNFCVSKSLINIYAGKHELADNYQRSLFGLLELSLSVPDNIKPILERRFDYDIKGIHHYHNIPKPFFHTILQLNLGETQKRKIMEEFRNLKQERRANIQQGFIDVLLEFLDAGEEELVKSYLEAEWSTQLREEFALNAMVSAVMASPDTRSRSIGLALDIRDYTNEIMTVLGMFGSISDTYSKYKDPDLSANEKMSFQNRVLSGLIELPKFIDKALVNSKHRGTFQRLLNRFKETVNKEVSKAIYLPDLELSLETKNIPLKENTSIVFAVSNIGSGLANNVAINLCESDDFAIERREKQYGIITPNQSVSGEFIVNPLKEGDLPINIDISYSNLKNEVNEISFSEVISIYSQREFKRIESPYITGTPITGREMFFGRGDLIEDILGKLKGVYQDNVLVLYGQRRTGKTSILYQLKDDYIKPPYHAVLIDMQGLKSARTSRLCRKIAEMCIFALSKDKVEYEQTEHKEFGQIFEDDPIGALGDFFEELERKLPDHRILLLFDEFEGLIENITDGKVDKDLFPFLRSVMQHRKNVSFIFTGADKLREMLEDYASIMFNIAEFVPIGYLKPEEARELITNPVSGKIEYQENAVSHIIKSTDANPFYIQHICRSLVERMNEEKRNVITIIDVEKVIENLISVGTYFDHLWDQSSSNEKLVLSYIAQETATINDWVRYDTISEFMKKMRSELCDDGMLLATLKNLTAREIIDQKDIDGQLQLKIKIDMFRLRCKQYYPYSRVSREVVGYG